MKERTFEVAEMVGRMRSALYAIAHTYNDDELRAKAAEAYEQSLSLAQSAPAATAPSVETIGTLCVEPDPDATFGYCYDISTNAEGHARLRALNGAQIYVAAPAPSASPAAYEASHHNAVCIDGECRGCIASPAALTDERAPDLYDEIECDLDYLFGRASKEGYEAGQKLAEQVKAKMQCARALLAASLAAPTGAAAVEEALAQIGAILGPGSNELHTLLVCIRNIKHFADCLDAVERAFFMVPGEPDDEFPDEKPDDECLLNRWGSTVEQYVEQFRAAIPHLLAAQPPAAAAPESAAQAARDVQSVELELYRMAYGPQAPTNAAMDVLAERQRQISAEGWTPEHDDDHGNGDLARAAGCYALYSARYYSRGNPPSIWPWAPEWWKPTESRHNLVKAGALILAEIERIDRAAMGTEGPNK